MPNATLLDPTSQGDVSAKFLAPRLNSLDGKVMGLLNITKNGSDIFLDRIAELMQERFDLAEVIHVNKPTSRVLRRPNCSLNWRSKQILSLKGLRTEGLVYRAVCTMEVL